MVLAELQKRRVRLGNQLEKGWVNVTSGKVWYHFARFTQYDKAYPETFIHHNDKQHRVTTIASLGEVNFH